MKVFISHIHEEASFALVLKDWVGTTFAASCDVFVSSDHNDLPAGAKWLEEIDGALDESAAVITVCSPASISRPWINFEAGCAWIKRKPIIPICHSGLTRNALPEPLSRFQALDFDKQMPELLTKALAKRLNVKRVPRIAYTEMFDELQAALPKSSQQPQAPSASANQLDEKEREILLILAENNTDFYAEDFVQQLQVKPAKMDYHLDRLCDLDYVNRTLSMMSPTSYSIAKAGRAYLVSAGLL